MTQNVDNPYRPPNIEHRSSSWWTRLLRFLFGEWATLDVPQRSFLLGAIVMIEGIAFFVDPGNKQQLFAVSASTTYTKKRQQLIRDEAFRCRKLLMELYPGISDEIQRWNFTIRIVGSYEDCKSVLDQESPGIV